MTDKQLERLLVSLSMLTLTIAISIGGLGIAVSFLLSAIVVAIRQLHGG